MHTLDKEKQGRAGQVRAGLIILFNGIGNTEYREWGAQTRRPASSYPS